MDESIFGPLDAAIKAAPPPGDRAALVVGLSARLAILGAGLVSDRTTGNDREHGEADRNVDVTAAAERLGVSKAWLYKHGRTLPFAAKVGRRLVFSSRGLEVHMARLRRQR